MLESLTAIDIIGYTGAVLIVLVYGLISLNLMKGTSKVYQLINLIGAILLIINTLYLKAYAPMMVNIFWVLIAIVSLLKKDTKKAE